MSDPAAPPAAPPTLFARMAFTHPWRTYQAQILDLFERRDPAKRTFHVVAPPGSGKTLVGIEIARRIGRPAVTFSPTTTIQEQWRDKVGMFLPEGSEPSPDEVSTDPGHLGAITSLTYQSLSTQTEDRDFLERLGRRVWWGELVAGGRTEEGAERHLADLQTVAGDEYAKGVSSRAGSEKRRLLASGQVAIAELLHPNALATIEAIVAAGTGCLILDEAHHLRDYWALILAELIGRLPTALVVGLTATPPASADPEELGNYLALVDGIDFEVPTPAVVRSGHLAPYQDLVLLTEPTPAERVFLASQEELVAQAVARAFDDPRFPGFVEARVNRSAGIPTWASFVDEEFAVAVAGVRYLLAAGRPLAADVEVVEGMRAPLTREDHLILLRDWALGFLRRSDEPADREALADLRAALRALGMTMTEVGWRPAPSPVQRVLAYSASKVAGMVRVLRAESESMGPDLRAVVLTDFERSSVTALRRLEGVLDPEAGGAVAAARALAGDPGTRDLDPVMVTARTVLVDSSLAPTFVAEAQAYLERRGLRATLSVSDAGDGLSVVDGEGPGWEARHYVACVTELFERGVTRCIVGTRGLLSEGWDSLALNTLVDLTTAGTFASVNQIRGRSIRLDPAHPRKVADNWDLACVASGMEGGRGDLDRLIAKHRHVWGLGSKRRVVKGIGHVDQRLLVLDDGPWREVLTQRINARSFNRAADRDAAYEAWGVGHPYENFEFRGTALRTGEIPLRTAFSWTRTLRRLLNLLVGNLVLYLILFTQLVPVAMDADWPGWLKATAYVSAMLLPVAFSAPLIVRYVREAFLRLPVDSYLADFGKAVAEALRDTGLAAASPQEVRVTETDQGTYEIHLDTKDAPAAALFSECYEDLFDPIVDQRYLVVREEVSMSGTFYRPVWYLLRGLLRLFRRHRIAYHAVPAAFGRKRELAEAFGRAWTRWVGGGRLVYTRSAEGAAILLRERAAAKRPARTAHLEEWR